MEPLRQRPGPLKIGGYDLVALGLFAIAGAILALDIVIVYIGINLLNVIGVEWHWIWEGWRWR